MNLQYLERRFNRYVKLVASILFMIQMVYGLFFTLVMRKKKIETEPTDFCKKMLNGQFQSFFCPTLLNTSYVN
jgi:hypothetical protein